MGHRVSRLWILPALVLAARPAAAAPTCVSTVAAFNTFMAGQTTSATELTMSFTVTGVKPSDYNDSKGWLAEFADSRCSGLSIASLKVYGTATTYNPAHPPGTLKLEYGTQCCSVSGSCPIERWAEPMPGDSIFSTGSEICTVVMSATPAKMSYDISCDNGKKQHAEGPNTDSQKFDKVAVLQEVSGGHAMTNATASKLQICYVLGVPPVGTQNIPVKEDVTVAPTNANTVYPDATDLACGNNDSWAYLKFDLSSVNGRVTSAKLFLHSGTFASAAGTGGDVKFVASNAWSENTLTWNARPTPAATAVGRVSGVTPDNWYSVDVSAQVKNPAIYSFALVPQSSDTDTAHFISKEGSSTLGPYLAIQVNTVDADGDKYVDVVDCNDANPAIHPGATEICDGIDNDCDKTIDEGCAPGLDAGISQGDGVVAGDGARPDSSPAGGEINAGCGCAAPGWNGDTRLLGLLLILGAFLIAWRVRSFR